MKTILLDTDIADDIDDALALAMMLNSGEFDILGVTTVHGEVELRTRVAAKMLHMWECPHIPVATGFGMPYNQEPRTGVAQSQAAAVGSEETFSNVTPMAAPDFLMDKCREYGKPLTVLAIGPLTNLARTIEKYPQFVQHVDELVLMGAGLHKDWGEYNIKCDPEAAAIVFGSGLEIRAVPIDITETCAMRETTLDLVMQDDRPHMKLLADLIVRWQRFDGRRHPVLHDPLAVGCLLQPDLFEFESFDVNILLEPEEQRGVSVCQANAKSKIKVCTSVDYERFNDLFDSLLMADIPKAVS